MKRFFRTVCSAEADAGITEVFPFLSEKKHIISFVGAGGKTSLLFEMAAWCKEQGYCTLVTTTTHMYRPDEELRVHELSDLGRLWGQGMIAVMGDDVPDGKISAPGLEMLKEGCRLADMVLIEADGAKRMPCKVPKKFEPVLLPWSDIVVGVMGMKALGKPLREVCFRAEKAMKLLHVDENHIMKMEDLAAILCSEQGTRKMVGSRAYVVVLNQCDTPELIWQGEQLSRLLYKKNIQHVVLSGLTDP